MIQGGDITHGTGMGGESIYGESFEVALSCLSTALLPLFSRSPALLPLVVATPHYSTTPQRV